MLSGEKSCWVQVNVLNCSNAALFSLITWTEPATVLVILGLRELQRRLCLMFNGQGHYPGPDVSGCEPCLHPKLAVWVSGSHSGFLSLSAKMETAEFLYLSVGAPFISLGMFSSSSYKFCQDKTWGFLYIFLLWLTGAVAADPAVLLVIWQPWSCRWLNSSTHEAHRMHAGQSSCLHSVHLIRAKCTLYKMHWASPIHCGTSFWNAEAHCRCRSVFLGS